MRGEAREQLARPWQRRAHLVHIAAGAEGAAAPGEHHRAHVGVARRDLQRLAQRPRQRHVQGVELPGAGERDEPHRAVVADLHVHDGASGAG